ncbi:MAG: ParB/RepB/Spo0J family partition protein [Candidatus Hydrogenedentes bacterium]|nr:ParB/RepB/Spo0J family partition protein [Candidatus Hydrogenedentota bacterium]
MSKFKKGGLGRGLGALIPGRAAEDDTPAPIARPQVDSGSMDPHSEAVVTGDRVLDLDPHAITPNPKQPRTHFNEEALKELADSIARDGVMEPVIVRRVNGEYQLVSGERRVRASMLAGVATVPAIVREINDADMLKFGLIENIQREDLNAIELARGYEMLMREFNWTQEQCAEEVGKKRVTITNTLRLLNLPEDVQNAVVDGSITMGHARALLSLPNAKAQLAACQAIIEKGLSVRQVERMTSAAELPAKTKHAAPAKNPNIAAIEDDLRKTLGTRVSVAAAGKDMSKGKIIIDYYSLDDFDRILDRLKR